MLTRHPLCGRQRQTPSSPNYRDFVKVFPGEHIRGMPRTLISQQHGHGSTSDRDALRVPFEIRGRFRRNTELTPGTAELNRATKQTFMARQCSKPAPAISVDQRWTLSSARSDIAGAGF